MTVFVTAAQVKKYLCHLPRSHVPLPCTVLTSIVITFLHFFIILSPKGALLSTIIQMCLWDFLFKSLLIYESACYFSFPFVIVYLLKQAGVFTYTYSVIWITPVV